MALRMRIRERDGPDVRFRIGDGKEICRMRISEWGVKVIWRDVEEYEGETVIIPQMEVQTFSTEGKKDAC